jgi:hypothetical protein
MDDIVKQALKKWPNVPHCYGRLGHDARGDWYMRDDRAQAAGPFPAVKGSRIEHEKLREFIERNYASDGFGSWFFQNGPQRVYVELEAAPWVFRLSGIDAWEMAVTSHTGRTAQVETVWLDDQGRVFVGTDIGLGIVHTLDMEMAAAAVECGVWVPVETHFVDLVSKFGYRLSPATDQAASIANSTT